MNEGIKNKVMDRIYDILKLMTTICVAVLVAMIPIVNSLGEFHSTPYFLILGICSMIVSLLTSIYSMAIITKLEISLNNRTFRSFDVWSTIAECTFAIGLLLISGFLIQFTISKVATKNLPTPITIPSSTTTMEN